MLNDTTRKWIHYEDYSFEPVNPDENINNKKHTPNRRWFVVDKDKDWRPTNIAPEASHPRHRGNMTLPQSTANPRPTQHTSPSSKPAEGVHWLRDPNLISNKSVDEQPPKPAPEHQSLRGKSFHAAVDRGTGKVRMLNNGFDPNVVNARDIQEREKAGQRPFQKSQ